MLDVSSTFLYLLSHAVDGTNLVPRGREEERPWEEAVMLQVTPRHGTILSAW